METSDIFTLSNKIYSNNNNNILIKVINQLQGIIISLYYIYNIYINNNILMNLIII